MPPAATIPVDSPTSDRREPPGFANGVANVKIVTIYDVTDAEFSIEFSKQVSEFDAFSLIFIPQKRRYLQEVVRLVRIVPLASHKWRVRTRLRTVDYLGFIYRYLRPSVANAVAVAQRNLRSFQSYEDFRKSSLGFGYTNGQLIDAIGRGPGEVKGHFVWLGEDRYTSKSVFVIQAHRHLRDERLNRDVRWFLSKGEDLIAALRDTEIVWRQVNLTIGVAFAMTLADVAATQSSSRSRKEVFRSLPGFRRFAARLRRLAEMPRISIKRPFNVGQLVDIGVQAYGASKEIRQAIAHYRSTITAEEAEEEVREDAEAVHSELRTQAPGAEVALGAAAPVVGAIASKALKGAFGEKVAALALKSRGYDGVISLQNASGNGIDLIGVKTWGKGKNKRNLIVYFEVKTTERASGKSSITRRQRNIKVFVREILVNVARKKGRYKNVSNVARRQAQALLDLHDRFDIPIGGAVIDVRLARGGILGLLVKVAIRGRWTQSTAAKRGTPGIR